MTHNAVPTVLIAGSPNTTKGELLVRIIKQMNMKSVCVISQHHPQVFNDFDHTTRIDFSDPSASLHKLKEHNVSLSLCIEDSHAMYLGWLNEQLNINRTWGYNAAHRLVDKYNLHQTLGQLHLPQWPTVLPQTEADWAKVDGAIYLKPTLSTSTVKVLPQDYNYYQDAQSLLDVFKQTNQLHKLHQNNQKTSPGHRWILQKYFNAEHGQMFELHGVVIDGNFYFDSIGELKFHAPPNDSGFKYIFTKALPSQSQIEQDFKSMAAQIMSHFSVNNTHFLFEAFYVDGELYIIDVALRMTAVNSILSPKYLEQSLLGFTGQNFNLKNTEYADTRCKFYSFPYHWKEGRVSKQLQTPPLPGVTLVGFDQLQAGDIIPSHARAGHFPAYMLFFADNEKHGQEIIRKQCEAMIN